MFSLGKTRIDYTAQVAAALGATEAAGQDEYPQDPDVNDTVLDTAANVVKAWDGAQWVTVHTRGGRLE